MYVPLASTSPCASPMFVHPGGGAIRFQELVSGLYSAPFFVHTGLPPRYSPPSTIM